MHLMASPLKHCRDYSGVACVYELGSKSLAELLQSLLNLIAAHTCSRMTTITECLSKHQSSPPYHKMTKNNYLTSLAILHFTEHPPPTAEMWHYSSTSLCFFPLSFLVSFLEVEQHSAVPVCPILSLSRALSRQPTFPRWIGSWHMQTVPKVARLTCSSRSVQRFRRCPQHPRALAP